MKIGKIDLNQKVMIIAEIGNNHEGDISVALELIHRAIESGADAVKFQTFRTEHYVDRSNPERFDRLKRFEFSPEQFALLAKETEKAGSIFLSTPFDLESVKILNPLVAAYKISSGDTNFVPLLQAVAATQKPLILSSGLTTLAELRYAVGLIQSAWIKQGISQQLALLHCVSSYPVPFEQANLKAIQTLHNNFPDLTIGYSDHTLGIDAALSAVSLGAKLIEKHFTLAHDFSDFRDHQLSATPQELKLLVEKIRVYESMLGSGEKIVQPCEVENQPLVRRSIAAGKDLKAGTCLCLDDFTWVRPGWGYPPGEESVFLGRILKQSLAQGTILSLEMLE
jgi:N,N'-diacetyllegionaminate synthase